MSIAHTRGAYDVYKGPSNVVPTLASGAQFPAIDPLYLVRPMSAVTRSLIFVSSSVGMRETVRARMLTLYLDHSARVIWCGILSLRTRTTQPETMS
jgi:hypothetical protein